MFVSECESVSVSVRFMRVGWKLVFDCDTVRCGRFDGLDEFARVGMRMRHTILIGVSRSFGMRTGVGSDGGM